MFFILAIATDRKVGLVRKRREERDSMMIFRSRHLGSVFSCEFIPLTRSLCIQPQFHRWRTRRKIGKPDVVPVLGCKLTLRHSSWRTANGSDPKSFSFCSFTPQPNDTDCHNALLLGCPKLSI